MKNVILFINPRSRNGQSHSDFVKDWLQKNNFKILNSNSDCSEEDLMDTFKRHQNQAELVIIGGGDGSLRSALPGLLAINKPFLYLPVGTLNNLARTLNLPLDIAESLELIKNHEIHEIQIATANGIPFHTVLGLGLSTQVNRFVRSELKRWLGALAFFWTGLKVIYRMSPFRINLIHDGKIHVGRSWQVTICNGKYYGSGFEISPKANMEDGVLRGLSIETKKWWHAFQFVPMLMSSRRISSEGIFFYSGKEMTLKTRFNMRVDLDGDVKTKTPLELKLHPERLKILVPKNVSA